MSSLHQVVGSAISITKFAGLPHWVPMADTIQQELWRPPHQMAMTDAGAI